MSPKKLKTEENEAKNGEFFDNSNEAVKVVEAAKPSSERAPCDSSSERVEAAAGM